MSIMNNSVELLKKNKTILSNTVSNWVKENYPFRTQHYDKCTRDVSHIIDTLILCLKDNKLDPVEFLARRFFKRGILQLKSTGVEFEAYNVLLNEIKILISDSDDYNLCKSAVFKLKEFLHKGVLTDVDKIPATADRETMIQHTRYAWDDEQRIMRNMQQCQRNWYLDYKLADDTIEYLLWIAKNAPSKQHEAYYDVYYSSDREVIEYLYQFSWGSTYRRNPPSCWRNSQMNANFYMIFVCKQPPTMYNCNNDGTDQDANGLSRWENSIISVGMAMGLVMRAANKMGFSTGPNKIKDLGPDYNYEWEKRLGIYEDVIAGRKKLYYGLGIGVANSNRPRWESDDTELALGASNGHNITTQYDDPDFNPIKENGQEKRKVKIVDVKGRAGEEVEDPYGNIHVLPEKHEIKINTIKERDIKTIEIPKND